MKSIIKDLEEVLAQPTDDIEFVDQVRRIREFKRRLDEAGVVLEPETLPDTMTLIGHLATGPKPETV